ncbi:DUF998 domain-containing protein [Nocardia sp. NPDC004722]
MINSHEPSPRWVQIAGVCWAATVAYFVISVLVGAAWTDGYHLGANYISDLGVTDCLTVAEQGNSRWVCSPWHPLWNSAMIATGALTALGALAWAVARPDRWHRAGCLLLVLAGAATAGCGAVPWNRDPELHDTFALAQWLVQIFGMAVLAATNRRRYPAIAPFTGLALLISAFGGIGLYSKDHFGLAIGLIERLAFDTLTVWTVAIGAILLAGPKVVHARKDSLKQPPRTPDRVDLTP